MSDGDATISWTHTVTGASRIEILASYVGDRVVDVVLLDVDADGMPL